MKELPYHGMVNLGALRRAHRENHVPGTGITWLVKIPQSEVGRVEALPGYMPRDVWSDKHGPYQDAPAAAFGACENFVFEVDA